MIAPCLPGLEDVHRPPGPSCRAEALDRLEFKPARHLVFRALLAIAGARTECSPTNAAIRARVAELAPGREPPSDRQVSALLALLEREDRLIARERPGARTLSGRRIRFTFVAGGDADRQHPPLLIVNTPPRRKSLPP